MGKSRVPRYKETFENIRGCVHFAESLYALFTLLPDLSISLYVKPYKLQDTQFTPPHPMPLILTHILPLLPFPSASAIISVGSPKPHLPAGPSVHCTAPVPVRRRSVWGYNLDSNITIPFCWYLKLAFPWLIAWQGSYRFCRRSCLPLMAFTFAERKACCF